MSFKLTAHVISRRTSRSRLELAWLRGSLRFHPSASTNSSYFDRQVSHVSVRFYCSERLLAASIYGTKKGEFPAYSNMIRLSLGLQRRRRAIIMCLICSAIGFLLQPSSIISNLFARRTVHNFDPLTTTAWELQEQLSARKITSVELCKRFLYQISEHDHYLNAVLAITPTALSQAALLDKERFNGKVRGPLHGIPILVKVGIRDWL